MYSKGCGLDRVNEARLRLFTSGKKKLEALPPTQAALCQHIRRAKLQGSFFGIRQLLSTKISQTSMIGGGTWTTVVGCLSGHTLMTTAKNVPFLCIVAVRNHAQVTASAAELGFAAQVYANAKGGG